MKRYYKVWFSNGTETTAKLVLDTERYPIGTSVAEYSRLFPYSEAGKMKRLVHTSLFDSWLEAFKERSHAMGMLVAEVK